MKRLIRCIICGRYVGLYRSYKVRITELLHTPGTPKSIAQKDTFEGHACPACTEAAGYKIGRKHKSKKKESDEIREKGLTPLENNYKNQNKIYGLD